MNEQQQAAWLADFVIQKHGGTDDLPAWVAQSARYWNELSADRDALRASLAELNTPEIEDFARGVVLEAAHQKARWGSAHDRSKSAENWFWLVGYLAGKALRASLNGDREKALHHTISAAACLAHWHQAIKSDTTKCGLGQDDDLREDV